MSDPKITPIANLLGASTNDRREAIMITGIGGASVAPDPATPTFVTVGTVVGTFDGTVTAPHSMPYQVGDTLIFRVTPEPTPGSLVDGYVWRFWDGSSEATTTGTITKRLNMGGHPMTGYLSYTVTVVGFEGEYEVISDSLEVNNPPVVVPPTVLSVNDQYFPFDTRAQVTVFDWENETMAYGWYTGDTFLSTGTTTSAGPVSGTWMGNGTRLVVSRSAYTNNLDLTVANDTPLTFYVYDTSSGTTSIDFNITGAPKPPPVSGISGGSSADSTAILRIGAGEQGTFSAYARDATGQPVSFQWQFSGSNGWTTGPVNVTGTTVTTEDGGYANVYVKDISGETVTDGTQKTSTAYLFISSGGVTNTYPFAVTLVQNQAPSGITFSAKVNGADYNLVTLLPVAAGSKIELAASVTDPENDAVTCQWTIAQPGSLLPSVLVLKGPKIVINTTGYSGNTLQATVVATDALGASTTETTPAIPIS